MSDPGWWKYHSEWVAIFQWLVVPLPILAWLGRPPRWRRTLFACIPLLQIALQYVFAHRAIEGRLAIGLGLHALDAGLLAVDRCRSCSWFVRLTKLIGTTQSRGWAGTVRAVVIPGFDFALAASMERATIFVGRSTKSYKNCRRGNETGSNHHENVDARRLFGGGMRRHARSRLRNKCRQRRPDVLSPGGKSAGRPRNWRSSKLPMDFTIPSASPLRMTARDASFVVERGRPRQSWSTRAGRCCPSPSSILTNFNPLGTDVQTGFVEQGLWSVAFHPKFKDNGYAYVHYASLPFNGASIMRESPLIPRAPIR